MFISVPEERFRTDILKTRISYFKNDSELAWVSVLSRKPDVDTDLKIPNICITRIWNENRTLARLSWFFDYQSAEIDSATIWRLMWYTLTCSYQFDIMTKTIWDMNKYVSIVERKLKSNNSTDTFAELGGAYQTVIPILDFVSPTDTEWVATDLYIRFRMNRNVDWVEVIAFDQELHQYSITIDFRVHYLKEYELPKINSIQINETPEI